ncbi:Lsr2 family protein [Pilimelia terevasa]|uniref:Lsr2 family protein n=1 Tax=Pilimelia terevasa TaxID=53372 RepID=A0A8J3BR03_9ACTN|nr:Lsr2 family protein [Pilimelia terevasa]GGK43317.1 Lsr2 family protein [Pilimelia terevasa]
MARQTITVLTDDLDGGTAEESITFGLDGISYEIDLSANNAGKLRETLQAYIEKATRIGRGAITPNNRRRNSPSAGTAAKDRELNKSIRQWAQQEGKPLSGRGRIPQTIVNEYLASH